MAESDPKSWKTLNKDLERISTLEQAVAYVSRPLVAPGIGLAFMVLVGLVVASFTGVSATTAIVIAAAVVGAYMALNIGANDVANNMGPAVGARAMTIGTALVVAAICETAGALLAGAMWFRPSRAGSYPPKPWPTPRPSSGRCFPPCWPGRCGSISRPGWARRYRPPTPSLAV